MSDIIEETNELKMLILDENLKAPDKSGTTPLLARAKIISAMSPLSPTKKFQENVVCNLVKYFSEFNQIHFSELESYIMVAEFTGDKILESFNNFVRNKNGNEDIVFKACVARTIQNLDRTAFSLVYITNRFKDLNKLDPWLLAELIIVCNWEEGVAIIKKQLNENYDASYLFSLLPTWMKEKEKEKNGVEKISFALSEWFNELAPNDQTIAEYYANNYGYKISAKPNRAIQSEVNQKAIEGIISDKEFLNYKKKVIKINFESLSC